jgi:hypothetical protein
MLVFVMWLSPFILSLLIQFTIQRPRKIVPSLVGITTWGLPPPCLLFYSSHSAAFSSQCQLAKIASTHIYANRAAERL